MAIEMKSNKPTPVQVYSVKSGWVDNMPDSQLYVSHKDYLDLMQKYDRLCEKVDEEGDWV